MPTCSMNIPHYTTRRQYSLRENMSHGVCDARTGQSSSDPSTKPISRGNIDPVLDPPLSELSYFWRTAFSMGFELYYKLLFCASVWLRVKTCPEMSGRSTRALAALSFQWTRSREISSGLLSLSQRSGGANFYRNSKLGAKSNLLSKIQRPRKRLSFKSISSHLQ